MIKNLYLHHTGQNMLCQFMIKRNILVQYVIIKQHKIVLLQNMKKSFHQGDKYPCTICGHKASSQYNLTKHIQSKHKGKKIMCNSCNKEYTDTSSLKKHIKSAN